MARTRNRAGNLQATTTSRARQPTNTRQPAIIAEASSLSACTAPLLFFFRHLRGHGVDGAPIALRRTRRGHFFSRGQYGNAAKSFITLSIRAGTAICPFKRSESKSQEDGFAGLSADETRKSRRIAGSFRGVVPDSTSDRWRPARAETHFQLLHRQALWNGIRYFTQQGRRRGCSARRTMQSVPEAAIVSGKVFILYLADSHCDQFGS